MVTPNTMLISRPRNCRYCGNGYFALKHAVDYARGKGWNVTDISGKKAIKENIYQVITDEDPAGVYHFGHGLYCLTTGDTEEEIWSCENCDNLSGRIVYLLSCLTANGLGPQIIYNGAIAYAGFNISWTWIIENDETEIDPYNDKYGKGFWESANELWIALCDGEEFHASVQRSIDKYNAWIDYWYYDNPEDPYSQECIKWLAFDRDGLVALDVCDAIQDETECLAMECLWHEGKCYSSAPSPRAASLAWIIPVVCVVGLAYFVSTGKIKL